MQTDVKSAHRSTAGSFYAGRTRLKGFVVTPVISTVCTFEIRDGSASGEVLFTMIVFTLLYGVLAVIEFNLMIRAIKVGPEKISAEKADSDQVLTMAY